MHSTPEEERLGGHKNAFGFLRLLLASLVIVSHTPELADGDRHREILTQLFGTISFGELAVDGFFLISGFLIVSSFVKQPDNWLYLKKRIARIYPAFLVASAISLLVVAPMAGARLSDISPAHFVAALFLKPPDVPTAFLGSHYPVVNGAMWTIAYEFTCYLLVLVLGAAGAFRRPWLVGAIGAELLIEFEILPRSEILRLTGLFLIGATFFLQRASISFTWRGVVVAAAGLIGCLFIPRLAEPGVALFGGYLLFAAATSTKSGVLSQINSREDISYGVYLYAWPIEKLVLWYCPALPIFLVGLLTLAGACLCGWLSWHMLEKRTIRRLRDRAILPSASECAGPLRTAPPIP